MIVWGGSGTSYLDTGGRYDVGAGSWQPTSTIGAPQARVGHAAVWADDALLVWGGYNGNYLGTGGRYCACAAGTYFRDADGDGRGDPAAPASACGPSPGYVEDGTDCDDADAGAWGTPTEVLDLRLTDIATLTWSPPAGPGGLNIIYDVLRSGMASDFVAAAVCVGTNGGGTSVTDPEVPPPGASFFYLVRAENGCSAGTGPLGTRSEGTPIAGRTCP
jgi:hypothetical protein